MTLEIMYDLFAEAELKREGEVASDAYSCTCLSRCEYKTSEYLAPVAAFSSSFSVNEVANLPRGGRVELITGCPSVEGVTVKGSRLSVSGSLSGVVTLFSGGEYETLPYTVPWTCDAPLSPEIKVKDPASLVFRGDTSQLSLTASADGGLHVNAEVALALWAAEKRTVTEVAALTVTPSAVKRCDAITVYYPEPGEEVWDVAKRFRVPGSRVATDDNTDENGSLCRAVVI